MKRHLPSDIFAIVFVTVVIACFIGLLTIPSQNIAQEPNKPVVFDIATNASYGPPICGWDKIDSVSYIAGSGWLFHYNESNECKPEILQKTNDGPWIITKTSEQIDREFTEWNKQQKQVRIYECSRDYPEYCQPMKKSVCTLDGCKAVDAI